MWESDRLKVLPGRDGYDVLSKVMSVSKIANSGLYPIRYKLWETGGTYEVVVPNHFEIVSGNTYTIEVANGHVHASSSELLVNHHLSTSKQEILRKVRFK